MLQKILGYLLGRSASTPTAGVNKPALTEITYTLPPYSSVSVGGKTCVSLTFNDKKEHTVTATAPQYMLQALKVHVDNDVLFLFSDDTDGPTIPVDINIHCLRSICLDGASVLSNTAFIGEAIDISLAGSSYLELSGAAKRITLSVTGAASVQMKKCVVGELQATLTGASHTEVTVTKKVNVHASGAASIVIQGNPKEQFVEASGAAEVISI